MKTNIKVLIGVLALAVIGAAVYFSKSELQKGATRRPAGPQPDYEIASIIVDPANPVEGENFKISVIVKNKSSTTAATVPSKTLLHLSGQPLPIATTQPLGPLATEEEVWQTTSTQRRLLIRSCADADRAIAESNERNNCRERTLDLLPPQVQEQPPPPLPLCTEGQYNCESWTACSAEGSQTGTICSPNSPGTCLAPLVPLRACTPPMPDLVIDSVTLEQDVTGTISSLSTIRNAGTEAAVTSLPNNILYISTYLIDSGGNRIGSASFENIIASEGTSGRTAFTFAVGTILNQNQYFGPNVWGQAGVYGVRFTIDSRNSINESNETNNTYDITIPPAFLTWRPMPNLAVTSFTQNTSSPTARNPVNFSAAISNIVGTTTIASASTATLTIHGTSTSAALGEVYRQNVVTPELISRSTATTTVNFEWPSAIEGNYVAIVCADSANVVAESYENDNCTDYYRDNLGVTSFTVTPLPPPMPDLVIDSATAAQSTYSGSLYANVITIRNAGTAAANFTSSNSLRISGYLINSAGNRFGEVREVVIYSGGATTFTFQAGATQNVLSPYFYIPWHGDWSRTGVTGIRLTIDSSNSSNESNEINNTYDVTIPPEFLAWRPLPDLTVNQFTVNTTSPTAGNPVNFSARIGNYPYNATPGIVAGASTATLTINGTGTSAGLGEVYRQNVAIPELISGTTTGSITVNFEWPSASEGTYFAAICADSENVVVESDDAEWNNCTNASGRGYVTVAPAPSE